MTHLASIRALAGVLFLVLAALAAPSMAQTLYPGLTMQIQSSKGSTFPADSTSNKGPAGISLMSLDYSVAFPVDPARGMLTGARRYAPISFKKAIGNASPSILTAMLTNDPLTITVDVVGIGPTGTGVLLHRVMFHQARILSVTRKASTGDDGVAGEARRTTAVEATETVTFNFQRVEFDPGRPGGSIVDELQRDDS